MPQRRLIAEGWHAYAEHVLPKDVSAIQRDETRQAFYAGAAHLWGAFISALGPGEEADPPDFALADGVQGEIDEWLEGLKRGRR
jgi:hypothetical protein